MSDPGWQETLADVERAVAGCLAALDGYESNHAAVLTDHGEPGVSAPGVLSRHPGANTPGSPDAGWAARLAAARQRTDEAERLLAEQQTSWERWREAFTEWRRRIEQSPGVGHAEGRGDPAGGG